MLSPTPVGDAVAQRGEVVVLRRLGLAGRHDVDLDVVRQRGEVAEEAVPARDLERHQRDLPRPARRLERAVEAADVHDEDAVGAERDGAVDRDGVDDAAVDVVLAADLDRRQDARHRRAGEHGVDQRAVDEPVLGRALDRRRDALEAHRQVLDQRDRQRLGERRPQRVVAVQVRAGAGERGQAVRRASRRRRRERSMSDQVCCRRCDHRDRRLARHAAPLIAPPRSCRPPGRASMPRSSSARSIPTSLAPS